MASHSTVPLTNSARGWVDRISNIFRKDIAIDIDHLPPVSVFEVPKPLSAQKPEAYSPQLIALGPYHHLRPELYQMERYKLAAIKQISSPQQMFNFQQLVINKLKEHDPCTRACYNKFLEYDQDTLAWIVAIDGCFLLNLLGSYLDSDNATHKGLLKNAIFTGDIMMLENQIPFPILKEIRKCLNLSSPNDEEDRELFQMLVGFCEGHSPVNFTMDIKNQYDVRPLHLLDLMYHLIVNVPSCVSCPLEDCSVQDVSMYAEFRRSSSFCSSSIPSSDEGQDPDAIRDSVEAIFDLVESLSNKPALGILKPVQVVSNIPWSTVSGLFRKGTQHSGEKDSFDDEIAIPSVSNLWRSADVKCRPTDGSINDIKFVDEEATLYLPVLDLNASSEVIMRNLVAYEAAMSKSTLEFARFVNLMNGIIDTAEDVKLLRQNGVIKGALTDDEIAELFNGMKRSYLRLNQMSNIDIATEKINKYYDGKLMVRIIRQVKKQFFASWKYLAIFSTVMLFVVLILQSFCDVYGCSRFWKAI